MATVTGLTAPRMLAIEAASVVDGEVVGGNLILTKHDGTTIDAGPVGGPQGPPGPVGPSAVSAIPGEVRLWPGSVLPALATYGKWVWADGIVYVVATYPKAAGHIAPEWRTFGGASDPGAGNFRVPDLRGLIPVGMDAMPGGTRANRMTRSVAITIAAKTGEETHVVTIPEMPNHKHGGGAHNHKYNRGESGGPALEYITIQGTGWPNSGPGAILATGEIIVAEGSGIGHENVQPSVFVPYIVKLDD